MVEPPLISVIIPVHNTAGYLRKCIDSVRNQSLQEIEIILVDNLSTDGSSKICDEYALIDPRIKVLHLSVAGLSVARNAGIEIATSNYIGFIDSDDYIAPLMYQDMLNVLLQEEVELVYCNFSLESDLGIESPYPNTGNLYFRSQWEVLQDMMWERTSCSACNKLFKKTFFDKLRFPEGRLYEDRLVMHDWLVPCQKIAWIDKPYYYYVKRETSICNTIAPLNRYHYFLAEYARLEFMQKYPLFEGEESVKAMSRIIRVCYSLFCEVVELKPENFSQPIEDMRVKLSSLRSLSKKEIDVKSYKRICKITYFWPIYYFFRFYLKKSKHNI